jgi:hypothetical protein
MNKLAAAYKLNQRRRLTRMAEISRKLDETSIRDAWLRDRDLLLNEAAEFLANGDDATTAISRIIEKFSRGRDFILCEKILLEDPEILEDL